jgi:hypothetical protein
VIGQRRINELLLPVASIQGFTQNKLTSVGIVAQVQPIIDFTPIPCALCDCRARPTLAAFSVHKEQGNAIVINELPVGSFSQHRLRAPNQGEAAQRPLDPVLGSRPNPDMHSIFRLGAIVSVLNEYLKGDSTRCPPIAVLSAPEIGRSAGKM